MSLSITNVIKFEKTAEETVKTFKRERRARERYLKEVDEFNHAAPCASMEARVAFNASLADKYYEEEKEDFQTLLEEFENRSFYKSRIALVD